MTTNQAKRTTKPPTKFQTYMLRTCNSDYTSLNGFKYPKKGFVYAHDWNTDPACGNGLHGLLRGEGEARHLSTSSNAIWQVLMVDSREVVDLKGIVKVPRAWVLLSGTKEQAIAKMLELGCSLCVYGTVTVGDHSAAIVGRSGTAIAGYRSNATTGDYGTAIAGYRSTATAGDYGTVSVDDYGVAITGYGGTARVGYKGTAIADHNGTAIVGYGGTAIVGYGGTAVASYAGTIQIKYLDSKGKYRIATGYIGENGLLPNTKYKVDDNGKFYEVK